MMPKMWIEKSVEVNKPMPMLLVNEYMDVVAVDGDGEYITTINEYGVKCNILAQGQLEDAGYATDWAEWDDEGAFVRLKKENK